MIRPLREIFYEVNCIIVKIGPLTFILNFQYELEWLCNVKCVSEYTAIIITRHLSDNYSDI